MLYQLTHSSRAAACYLETLAWITCHQMDTQHGEWHMHVDGDGRPTGPKGIPAWKTPYHNGRAILVSLQVLEQLR